MTEHTAPARMVAVVTFDRIARSELVCVEIDCTADTDLEEAVREIAAGYLHPLARFAALPAAIADRYSAPQFTVDIDHETGVVQLSSRRPGHPAGDFGVGRITWREPS